MKFSCACCCHRTLEEPPGGTFEICPVCFWEDDNLQSSKPDLKGGANVPSLRQAQANYRAFGACERRHLKHVRSPRADEINPS